MIERASAHHYRGGVIRPSRKLYGVSPKLYLGCRSCQDGTYKTSVSWS